MADQDSKSDDECSSKITINVKTPTNKESIEVAEDASIKEVCYKLCLSLVGLELHHYNFLAVFHEEQSKLAYGNYNSF